MVLPKGPVRGAVPRGAGELLQSHADLPGHYSAAREGLEQVRYDALPACEQARVFERPPDTPRRPQAAQPWAADLEVGSDAYLRAAEDARCAQEDEDTRQMRAAVLEERRRLHKQLASTLAAAGHSDVSARAILHQTFDLDEENEARLLGAQMGFDKTFRPDVELPAGVRSLSEDLRDAMAGRAEAFESRLKAATTRGRPRPEAKPETETTGPQPKPKKAKRRPKTATPRIDAPPADKGTAKVLSRTEDPVFEGQPRQAKAGSDDPLSQRAERIRAESLLRGRAMDLLHDLHAPDEEAARTVAEKLELQRRETDPLELAHAELGIAVDELLTQRERVHTATTYIKSLEARVRALKREREMWIQRFRTEATNRATVLQLSQSNKDLQQSASHAHEQRDATLQLLEHTAEQQVKLCQETSRWRDRYRDATSGNLGAGGGLGREEMLLELAKLRQQIEALQMELNEDNRKMVVAQRLRDATEEAQAKLARGHRTVRSRPKPIATDGSAGPSTPKAGSTTATAAAAEKQPKSATAALVRHAANKLLSSAAGNSAAVGLQPPFHLLLLRVGDRIPFNPRDMSIRRALSVLHDCFQRKAMENEDLGDDEQGLFDRTSLGDYLVDCMVQRYGLRTVAEKHLLELIAAVRHFLPKSPRMMLFARVVGLVETQDYSNRAGDVYLGLLERTLGDDILSVLNARSEGLAIPAQLAADVLEATFPEHSLAFSHDRLELHDDVRDSLKNQFTRAVVPPPTHYGQNMSGRKIDFDAFCTICMQAFTQQDQRDRQRLRKLFEQAARVENTLNFVDFSDLVTDCVPEPVSSATMMRLFREVHAMCGNTGGTDFVQPEMVALALSTHGITPPYLNHRPPPPVNIFVAGRRRGTGVAPDGSSRRNSAATGSPKGSPKSPTRRRSSAARRRGSGLTPLVVPDSPLPSARRGSRRQSRLQELENASGAVPQRKTSRATLREALQDNQRRASVARSRG